MNKERLLELADHVEALRHWPMEDVLDVPEGCFNMNRWRYRCGAPACVAGHAVALWGNAEAPSSQLLGALGAATGLLDLDLRTARRLFTPQMGLCERAEEDYCDAITPKTVAGVIRELVATGIVYWPGVGTLDTDPYTAADPAHRPEPEPEYFTDEERASE